jgi:hypothetical protein
VKKLSRYLNHFNGRMIVTIAEGDNCVPKEDVISEFPSRFDIEFLFAQNDKSVGETPHFIKMAKMVESQNEDEITFYAHAKGVSYPNPSSAIRIWCDKMYYHNLADMGFTEHIFSLGYDSMGCFRRISRRLGKDRGKIWHFSGTFFWFRHSAVFKNEWKDAIRNDCRWGVEGFLGKMMPMEKSFCVYGAGVVKIGKRVHLSTRKDIWSQDTIFAKDLERLEWSKEFPPEKSLTKSLTSRLYQAIIIKSQGIAGTKPLIY